MHASIPQHCHQFVDVAAAAVVVVVVFVVVVVVVVFVVVAAAAAVVVVVDVVLLLLLLLHFHFLLLLLVPGAFCSVLSFQQLSSPIFFPHLSSSPFRLHVRSAAALAQLPCHLLMWGLFHQAAHVVKRDLQLAPTSVL